MYKFTKIKNCTEQLATKTSIVYVYREECTFVCGKIERKPERAHIHHTHRKLTTTHHGIFALTLKLKKNDVNSLYISQICSTH